MTPEQRRALERRRKEYQIVFLNDTAERHWPPNHRRVFTAIHDLGQIKYDEYGTKESLLTNTEQPWKTEVKLVAKKLTEKADQCLRRNEASWRFACEPLVFSRFNAEVACPNCRKRVWRSEIEAVPDTDTREAEQLRLRQNSRGPCRCGPGARPQDLEEVVGLNKIFIDRAQESVIHRPEVEEKLPKGEQPDRVYGLAETRNFQNLLYSPHEEGKLVSEVIQTQPYSEDGRPLLFPFLVVEAKSAKSVDDWYSLKLQTAFPIFTFLEVQQSLRNATGKDSRWKSGPLVWFFMNKGEDWRLYAAYQEPCQPLSASSPVSHETRLIELWSGCIMSRDGALQLLLIVDFICDWARDIYRTAILTELRILSPAANFGLRSTFTDSDIFSSRSVYMPQENTDSSNSLQAGDTISPAEQAARSTLAAFHALDSSEGILRHASPIESKFYALYLTADNITTLLNSIPTRTANRFCRQILAQLKSKSVVLLPENLDKIEQNWTGYKRLPRHFNNHETKFYTAIAITSYMTPAWDQVRVLSIIAVAQDAYGSLIAGSGLKPGRGNAKNPIDWLVDKDEVVATLSIAKDGSACHNLLAAIFRINYRIYEFNDGKHETRRICPDNGATWELVQHVYKSIKPGRLEPNQPFFRISTLLESQNIPSGEISWEGPFEFLQKFNVSPQGVVLINGGGHHHDPGRNKQSDVCVYLVRESLEVPSKEILGSMIKDTFEDYDVFHTTRDNGKINITQTQDTAPWNINRSYGFFFSYGGDSFSRWLKSLGRPLYTRQGSPRGPSDCGNILQREYSPWHDPRRINGGPYASMKEKFLKIAIKLECNQWSRISQDRYSQGINCCACCASVLGVEADVCQRCTQYIRNPRYPPWFGKYLVRGLKMRWSAQDLPNEVLADSAQSDDHPEYPIRTPSPDRMRSQDFEDHLLSGDDVSFPSDSPLHFDGSIQSESDVSFDSNSQAEDPGKSGGYIANADTVRVMEGTQRTLQTAESAFRAQNYIPPIISPPKRKRQRYSDEYEEYDEYDSDDDIYEISPKKKKL